MAQPNSELRICRGYDDDCPAYCHHRNIHKFSEDCEGPCNNLNKNFECKNIACEHPTIQEIAVFRLQGGKINE